jgi:maltose/moltooligosaccharide transporter
MGVYMGIFNFFIVIPQIINAIIGGPIVKYFYGGNPIYALLISGISLLIAAILVVRVKDVDDVVVIKI